MNSVFDSSLLTRKMCSLLLYIAVSSISDLKNYIIKWFNLQSNLMLLLKKRKQIFEKKNICINLNKLYNVFIMINITDTDINRN